MNELSSLQIFLQALRPKTLGAALAPVFIGGAWAKSEAHFQVVPFLAALWGALLLQIMANFANDLFDFQKGADSETRLGPARVTQKGWVTPAQMVRWIGLAFILFVPAALYLAVKGGWPIALLGVFSMAGALLYTGGNTPLGYRGWGDVMVLFFFGPAAVLGTAWVQGVSPSLLGLTASLGPGLLSTAILVVNNQRDRHEDRLVGKRTLAVRFGAGFSKAEYLCCHLGAYGLLFFMALLGAPLRIFVVLVVMPLSVRLVKQFFAREGADLNSLLAKTAQVLMLYSFLLSLSWNL